MVAKRVRAHLKDKSDSTSMTTAHKRRRLTIFGEPPLLAGEDAADFDELYDRVWEAVKPADTLEEMFIFDITCLEWEVLRWRRLKLSLMRSRVSMSLCIFLSEELNYDLYSERFEEDLAKTLEDNLPDDQADDASGLARACALNEKHAVDRVNQILTAVGMHLDQLLDSARRSMASELVQNYFRGESEASDLVNEILTISGKSMDNFLADSLAENLEYVERVDRLANIAESRRNDSLHEIQRRQMVFGQTLRRSVQQIEASDLEVIETPPAKGKKAA